MHVDQDGGSARGVTARTGRRFRPADVEHVPALASGLSRPLPLSPRHARGTNRATGPPANLQPAPPPAP